MDWFKIFGHLLFGIGIIGGAQGAIWRHHQISIIAIGIVAIGSILIGFKDEKK